jgi:hypothetical protein
MAEQIPLDEEKIFPDPPSFSDEDVRYCRETGDYKLIMFEWYRYVTMVGFGIVNILPASPAFRAVLPEQYHVLMGLLNRCTRLMLANVALSHEHKFGETTAIVDRCVFESAIKIIWLCEASIESKFTRYLADGLKTDLHFKAHIEANIVANAGIPLPMESRMLRSIGNNIVASGLTEAQIAAAKKLPDLAAMIDRLGYGRRWYIVGQRMGSHHIHGTWSSLLFHYLEEQEGKQPFRFAPRGHDCDTHINQFMFVPQIMLHAMSSYARYLLTEVEAETLVRGFSSIEDEIMEAYTAAREDAR